MKLIILNSNGILKGYVEDAECLGSEFGITEEGIYKIDTFADTVERISIPSLEDQTDAIKKLLFNQYHGKERLLLMFRIVKVGKDILIYKAFRDNTIQIGYYENDNFKKISEQSFHTKAAEFYHHEFRISALEMPTEQLNLLIDTFDDINSIEDILHVIDIATSSIKNSGSWKIDSVMLLDTKLVCFTLSANTEHLYICGYYKTSNQVVNLENYISADFLRAKQTKCFNIKQIQEAYDRHVNCTQTEQGITSNTFQ